MQRRGFLTGIFALTVACAMPKAETLHGGMSINGNKVKEFEVKNPNSSYAHVCERVTYEWPGTSLYYVEGKDGELYKVEILNG